MHEMKADGQLAADTKLRSSKYLSNLIEQDHTAKPREPALKRGMNTSMVHSPS
jgi:transposase-like protein